MSWGENVSPAIQGIPKEKTAKWAKFVGNMKCNRCGEPISRELDTDYSIILRDGQVMFLCKEDFIKVVLNYVPNADYFLPKHKFDVRFWTMNPSKTSAYISERHRKYRERKAAIR